MTVVSGLIVLLMVAVVLYVLKVDGPIYAEKRHHGSSVGEALLEMIFTEEE